MAVARQAEATVEREGTIVARLRQGDHRDLGELIDMHGNDLMHYLTALLGDRTAAEDVFQDVWVRVIERIHRFSGDRPFAPWLFRVARNRAYDVLRRERIRRPRGRRRGEDNNDRVEPVLHDRFDERLAASEAAARLLAALPPAHREVLWLRFYRELSYEEIAAVCRVPLGTVKSRLRRALIGGAEAYCRLETRHAEA